MTPAQKFVLTIVVLFLVLASLGSMHRRYLEYKLKKQFMQDQKEHLQAKIDDKVNEFFRVGGIPTDKEN